MKAAALILLIATIVFIVSLDVILEALPWPVLKFLGAIAAVFLMVLTAMAILCSMHSSMLSRQEEAARTAEPEHNPRGQIWS